MPRKRTKFTTSECSIDAGSRAATIRRRLLAWYDKHQRVMPWRARKGRTPNPYHVLVSEAMLQQTQVATVIPYFNRFMQELPTLRDLAQANEQQVLRLWQGLGYYRRAQNLHAAAKQIMRDHNGQVPDSVEALLKLPGVGRYTAGAIASIAHNRPAPILDGNVARVLARIFLIDKPIDEPNTRDQLWQLAEQLVPKSRPGDFNQSLMELGALVCTKANPTCLRCPLAKCCNAFDQGRTDDIPVPPKRKAPVAVHHHILAIQRRDQFLFQQRPETGLWSNMWQLPTLEDQPAKPDAAAIRRYIKNELGLAVADLTNTTHFKHQTTHRTIHFHLLRATAATGRLKRGAGQWRKLIQLDDLPLPNPQRKAIELLNE